VSIVTLYLGLFTGAVAQATIENGSRNSQRAQRGSPLCTEYVAATHAVRSVGSSSVRARNVKGTMVGVRLPPAREGNVTASVVRKRGGAHDAVRVTDSMDEGPL